MNSGGCVLYYLPEFPSRMKPQGCPDRDVTVYVPWGGEAGTADVTHLNSGKDLPLEKPRRHCPRSGLLAAGPAPGHGSLCFLLAVLALAWGTLSVVIHMPTSRSWLDAKGRLGWGQGSRPVRKGTSDCSGQARGPWEWSAERV